MTSRNTKQKSEIKQYLMSRTDHPTAEMVYAALKKTMPRISLGTVYRNLNTMADNGDIQRIRLNDNLIHFDAKTENHYHFICNDCGSVSDIWGVNDNIKAPENFDGKLDGHMTFFYGRCRSCLTQVTNTGSPA